MKQQVTVARCPVAGTLTPVQSRKAAARTWLMRPSDFKNELPLPVKKISFGFYSPLENAIACVHKFDCNMR